MLIAFPHVETNFIDVDLSFSVDYRFYVGVGVGLNGQFYCIIYIVLCIVSLKENGVRYYKLDNCIVEMKKEIVDLAEYWNQRYLSNIYDLRFVSLIARDVFGAKCLAASSVLGRRTWNSKHVALDPEKVKFIRGNQSE